LDDGATGHWRCVGFPAAAGVIFTDENGEGPEVRLRKDRPLASPGSAETR
jgi:hypothetical protein